MALHPAPYEPWFVVADEAEPAIDPDAAIHPDPDTFEPPAFALDDASEPSPQLDLTDIKLPTAIRHCLETNGISTVGDLLTRSTGEIGAERIAGFYCEPVIGAGGVRPAPDGYLKEAQSMIEEAGALFIADEVITGFCRVGDWFASNRFSLEPDLITFAKGVTSGYLPLGGVTVSPRVAEPFFASDAPMLRHGYTYSGHPTVAAAAIANLEIMEREGLAARVLTLEPTLVELMDDLADHPLVGDHRGGVGLLGALVLDTERLTADATLPARACAAIRHNGLISRVIAGDSLQISPPLVITESELDELASLMRAGLDEVR